MSEAIIHKCMETLEKEMVSRFKPDMSLNQRNKVIEDRVLTETEVTAFATIREEGSKMDPKCRNSLQLEWKDIFVGCIVKYNNY